MSRALVLEAPLAAEASRDVEVVTFGCRLNAYESEAIRARAAVDGLQDAVVFNTCAVTGEAVRQARQAIRKARRERPGARVIVTGCAAQIDPAAFAAMPEVDLVLGNAEKAAPGAYADLGALGEARVKVNDIFSVKETAGHLIDGLKDKARAYVEVQNGCDHRCTFCVIPYGRGNSRSAGAGEVVEQVRRLAAQGYREVVITGVDITSWGQDLPGQPTLGQLIARILKLVPELPRLRLSSIDAAEIDPDLMRVIAEDERLQPHLHLSLQHGDDMVLKRMKRRHSRADSLKLIAAVRAVRPETAFGADLIAGFPTETEEMFQGALTLVEEAQLSYLHVFPFSPRPGTPAAKMPPVTRSVVKARAERLRQAGDAALRRHLDARVSRTVNGLVEREGLARAEDFTEVAFEGLAQPGQIVALSITGHDGRKALGPAHFLMTDSTSDKRGWFSRLTQGLTRSSKQMAEQVVSTLTKVELHEDTIAELEDLLIEADFGPAAASRVANAYSRGRVGFTATRKDVMEGLAVAIAKELTPHQGRFDPMTGGKKPYVVLFVGVNGSGKTTTLGKIAADLKGRGAKVLIAAGDTFRAAAIEQLKVWGDRAGVPVVAREIGADSAGLAYEALERAKSEGFDVLLIDTAGRLQNKTALMDELAKVVRVLKKLDPEAPHETLLVLDATVGRNALSQVEAFDRTAGVTGVVMTKLDGTARGGVLVPVAEASHAPIKLIGVGEGVEDLQPFDAGAFARSLVGLEA